MQIEVDDVISIAVPSLFLMYPTSLLLIYTDALVTTWVITAPSSPHIDFAADQQILAIPDFASIYNFQLCFDYKLFQLSLASALALTRCHSYKQTLIPFSTYNVHYTVEDAFGW